MKHWLITGGAGFIGSHLCEALLERGDHVTVYDNFSTGAAFNLGRLRGEPGLTIQCHDVRNRMEIEGIDGIYNLACPASPVAYQKDPIGTTMTSVQGAYNVLKLARLLDVPVLHTSTSEVYGDPLVHPQREDYAGNVSCIGPRACYDEGKRAAESLMFDFHRLHGVQVRVARIFNTYGPWMSKNDGRVVSNFIVQALQGKPLTIYGDGQQTRSFCYVSDMVAGLMALMESDITGPVNLGNPVEYTMQELAARIIKKTGSKAGIRIEPLPQDDPKQRRPDIGLANSALGWHPKVLLDNGLDATINHFRAVI